jgi:hypothetical protein
MTVRQHFNSNTWHCRRSCESQLAVSAIHRTSRGQTNAISGKHCGARVLRRSRVRLFVSPYSSTQPWAVTQSSLHFTVGPGHRAGWHSALCQASGASVLRGASVRASAVTNLAARWRHRLAVASGARLRANLVARFVLSSVAFLVQSGNVTKRGNAA